jgi:histidinol phosphatase-like PHP family hydrolase
MERRSFIRNISLASAFVAGSNFTGFGVSPTPFTLKLSDLHVHRSDQLSIQQIVEIGKSKNIRFGVVDHPILWSLKNDHDLKNYIEEMRKYPVYIGLQPTYRGWNKNYSKELIGQLDYILMDAQIFPDPNGRDWQIWQFDTYIDDTEEFMKRYMDYTLKILHEEPLNVFGWPLFLPVCIARDYYSIWTEERMDQIIKAAKSRDIAIEINDMAHTPHEAFILKAKKAGLKFTFGSDSRNWIAGRLSYCKEVAETCKLTDDDIWLPSRKI